MVLHVEELHDATEALERARRFLAERPVEHNLLLTILDQSVEHGLEGTFWIVTEGPDIVGFAMASPPGKGAVLSRMPTSASRLLAERIGLPLPRVVGDASLAAAFAGRWTETRSTAVKAIEGQRLYELTNLRSVATADGSLRLARPTIGRCWWSGYGPSSMSSTSGPKTRTPLRISSSRRNGSGSGTTTVSSRWRARRDPPRASTRVQNVYTPPAQRGSGYATACVEHMSRVLTGRGLGCVLYTDLANPTSNAIYRRIGYEAVVEVLGYKFA